MSEEMNLDWERYFQKNKDREIRPLFLESLKYLNDGLNEKTSLDFGCGVGTETLAMLRNNFRVDAVDNQIESKKYIGSKLEPIHQPKFSFHLLDFSLFKFTKKYDFVYAYHSLPFCKSEDFLDLTNNIIHSVKTNGVFTGSFFGDQDEWTLNRKVTGITKEELLKLCHSFECLYFKETLQNFSIMSDEHQKLHVFDIIARRKND